MNHESQTENAPDENASPEIAPAENKLEENAVAPNVEGLATSVSVTPDVAASAATTEVSATPVVTSEEAPNTFFQSDDDVEKRMHQMSRRSFLSGAVAVGAAYGGWHWLSSRRSDGGVQWPFRRVLDTNGQLAQDYFSSARLAPTFLKSQISEERTNGDIGLGDDFDPKDWNLSVMGLASGEPLTLSLHDIKKLPRVEMTTELKCIEGWSVIVHWAGARFADFAAKYPPSTQSGDAPNVKTKPEDLVSYVSLATPDGGYYVGMDMPSALHPQTLLCYEMNGKPLTAEHGAPLRLVTPVKYGIKHIKRIGTIEYSNNRPADYWAEQGYDWYAGH